MYHNTTYEKIEDTYEDYGNISDVYEFIIFSQCFVSLQALSIKKQQIYSCDQLSDMLHWFQYPSKKMFCSPLHTAYVYQLELNITN